MAPNLELLDFRKKTQNFSNLLKNKKELKFKFKKGTTTFKYLQHRLRKNCAQCMVFKFWKAFSQRLFRN